MDDESPTLTCLNKDKLLLIKVIFLQQVNKLSINTVVLTFLKVTMYMSTIPLIKLKINEKYTYITHSITCLTVFMCAFYHMCVENLFKRPALICAKVMSKGNNKIIIQSSNYFSKAAEQLLNKTEVIHISQEDIR